MKTNKELIHQLAEEMAKVDVPALFSDENLAKKQFDFDREKLTDSFMKVAEGVAVKFGAKMLGEGYKEGFSACMSGYAVDDEVEIKKMQIKHGLVAEEKEVENG